MKKWIKNRKEILSLSVMVVLLVLTMFTPTWLQGKFFIGGGDVKTQWYEFYTLTRRETINAIRNKQFPFYSWTLFLGSNLWASRTTYGMFDIFNLLSYVLPFNYYLIYDIQCLIKFLTAAISIYLYFNYLGSNKKWSIICALCYAFSSYGMYFTSQPGFLSFFALTPLYFLGIEKYLKENKKTPFIIIVVLLFLTNYYLFFSLTIFSPFYYLYRFYNKNGSLKGWLLPALKLIGLYLVGLMISMIVMLPSALYILQNERVGGLNASSTFSDIKIYLHLIFANFVPSQTYIYENNVFNNDSHTLKEICLFSSSLISLLVPQFMCDKDKKYRISTSLLYVLMIIVLFNPIVSAMMNGFSEPCFRWTLIIVFMNICVANRYLNNGEIINSKVLKSSTIIIVITTFACFCFGILSRDENLTDYIKQFLIIVFTFVILLFMFASLYKKHQKLLITTVTIELVFISLAFGNKSIGISETLDDYLNPRYALADDVDYHELNNYLNSLDENNNKEYYRTFIPYDSVYWAYSYNFNIIYDLKGLMTYDSTYAPSFAKMRDMARDKIVGTIGLDYDIKEKNLINLLSTKYSITTTEDEIPFDDYEIVDNYRYGFIVSKNLSYRPLGTTYSKTMTYDELIRKGNDTKLLLEYLVSDDNRINDYTKDIERHELKNISFYNNFLSGEVLTNNDSFMVIALPYDPGWRVTVNKKNVDIYNVNAGLIGVPLEKGHNYIEMYFVPQGFKMGAIISFCGLLSFLIVLIFDKKQKKKYCLKVT